MGYLLHILLALGVLALRDAGWGADTLPLPLTAGALAVPHALSALSRRLSLAGRPRAAAAVESLVRRSPVGLFAVLVLLASWVETVGRWTGSPALVAGSLAGWPGPGLVLCLAPYALFELLAIDAGARLTAGEREAARRLRAFQVRMFLGAFLPFAGYVAISFLVGLVPSVRVLVEEVALVSAAATAGIVVSFALLLPACLRRTWDVRPLEPGPQRALLEGVAERAGFRCRELEVWHTGGWMANAAIVGFTAKSRVVFFSDALLAQLGPRSLAAVFAHEIGHAKGGHPLVFAAFALTFLLGGGLVLDLLDLESDATALLVFAGILLLWYAAFGFLSRRFELEADLASLDTMGESGPLAEALTAVGGAHAHERSSWRHFSTSERLRFLERAERDPAVGARLRRRLKLWSRAGFVLLAAVLVAQAVGLGRSLGRDLVVADLRLGRFERAAERLEEGDLGERLERLVHRAEAVPAGERSPEALELRALEALREGDPEGCAEWLELALLRGGEEAPLVLRSLDAHLEGRTPPVEALGGLEEAWVEAIRALLRPPE